MVMNPMKRTVALMEQMVVMMEKLIPSTVVDQGQAQRSTWIGVAGASAEDVLDVHRWRNGLCRCGHRASTEGMWRLHVAATIATTIGDDPRSLPTLTAYRER